MKSYNIQFNNNKLDSNVAISIVQVENEDNSDTNLEFQQNILTNNNFSTSLIEFNGKPSNNFLFTYNQFYNNSDLFVLINSNYIPGIQVEFQLETIFIFTD